MCYGDSNTWGQIPRSQNRFGQSIRWPSVLQSKLGEEFKIIEEGLPGRTFESGFKDLPNMLENVDTVTIMLGTNDLKNLEPKNIAHNLKKQFKLLKKRLRTL